MDTSTRYRLILDAVKDPLVVVAPNGEILLANNAATAFFDLDGPQNLSELRCDDDSVEIDGAGIRDVMSRYESVRDYALPGAAGATLDIESVRPDGEDELRLLHFRVPSRHREFWRDEMIALVSHEIKNPLSAMKHSVDILLSGTPGELTEGQRRFLGTSGRSIERLTHLVEGFLDVSRIHSGAFRVQRARVDVREFLEETITSFKTLFNVRHVDVSFDVDAAVGEAHLDVEKVEQVLVNLLSNALKHTPEGGRIRVSVDPAGVDAVGDDLRLLPWSEIGAPRLLVVRVEDNGLGMSTETLDTIFERHHAIPGDARGRGAHLGLNISRALVEAQGGSLDVESTLGIGTTVTVRLPQDQSTACVLTRMSQVREVLGRYRRSRRSAVFYAVGKIGDEGWDDISGTWRTVPVVNPETTATGTFHLWTITGGLAVGIAADRGVRDAIEEVFAPRHVACDDGAYLFSGYVVGACATPAEGAGFAQACNVAVARVARARAAMARAARDQSASDNDYVLNEWISRP